MDKEIKMQDAHAKLRGRLSVDNVSGWAKMRAAHPNLVAKASKKETSEPPKK